jgi:uncharacterized membrane protein YtjA (UPF0391 family)
LTANGPFHAFSSQTCPKNAARIASGHSGHHHRREYTMLKWAIIFAIISLVAGWLGFGGVSGAAATIAKVLFAIFIIIFLIIVLGLVGIVHLF